MCLLLIGSDSVMWCGELWFVMCPVTAVVIKTCDEYTITSLRLQFYVKSSHGGYAVPFVEISTLLWKTVTDIISFYF